MSDDHARAAEIDRLTSAYGWTKGLLAQAVRDRKAAQTLLNMATEAGVKLREQTERDSLELKLLRAVAAAAQETLGEVLNDHDADPYICKADTAPALSAALRAWRAYASKP